MKKFLWLAVSLALLGVPVAATTLVAMDVAALTKASDVVVRAKVLAVSARLTQDKSRVMTDTELEVLESLKAGANGHLTVMQPGGEVGDIGQFVAGTAHFTVGEEVVVFLERRGERYLVSGMVQGKFTVERSSDGKAAYARPAPEADALLLDPVTHQPVSSAVAPMTLDQLKAQIRAAVGTVDQTTPTKPGVKVTP